MVCTLYTNKIMGDAVRVNLNYWRQGLSDFCLGESMEMMVVLMWVEIGLREEGGRRGEGEGVSWMNGE